MDRYSRGGLVFWTRDMVMNPYLTLEHVLRYPSIRSPLRISPKTPVQCLVKCLFMQFLLFALCRGEHVAEVQSLLQMIMEGGASIRGWLPHHAAAMRNAFYHLNIGNIQDDWEDEELRLLTGEPMLADWNPGWPLGGLGIATHPVCRRCAITLFPEEENQLSTAEADKPTLFSTFGPLPRAQLSGALSLSCLLPVIIHLDELTSQSRYPSSETLSALIEATNLPWLQSIVDVPYAFEESRSHRLPGPREVIHDGPTCHHARLSPHQRKISLRQLTSAGSTVHPLQILCRDAIHRNLVEYNDDVFEAAQQLPLPRRMKTFLFYV